MTRLKHLLRLNYGDALSVDARDEGTVAVYGSNGEVGFHNVANTLAPAIIVGRKGSHGKVNWTNDAGFCIDTAYFVDHRNCQGHLRFAFYLLNSLELDRNTRDTGVPGLDRNEAHNREIFLPDLLTQKRIAAFLDGETARIDDLIAKKQRLVEVLRERANTIRSQTFRRIPIAEYRPLRWLITQICDGPFGSGLTSAHYTDAGVRVIRLQNIKDGGFDRSDSAFISEHHYSTLGDHDVLEHDLLIAGLGDDKKKVGRACLAPRGLGPAMVKADCYRVRLDSRLISHAFVAEYLCSDESWPQIDALAKGVTRSRLNLELVRRIRIPVPPPSEQIKIIEEISEARSTFSSLKEKVSNSIDRLREYRSALITAAVTGQIDVAEWGKQGTADRRLDAIQETLEA